MIVAIHGVPGLSFAELTYFLTELGIGFMAVNPKPVKVGGPTPDRVVPIVFNGAKSFIDNHAKIKFRSVAFVCDTYHRLRNELDWPVVGVKELGKDKHEYVEFASRQLGELIQQADYLKKPVEVSTEIKVYDPTAMMIEKFSETALSKAHTLMHRIKNQEMRAKTFALVKAWFTGGLRNKDVLFTKLSSIHKNEKYLESVVRVLTDKDGMSLRKLVVEGKNKPHRIDSIAKKAGIDPFDIRYLLSGPKK